MIYVTHDQVEALTLADRIAVMRGGVIQQVGEPEEIYRRPANRFVAGFLGSPPMNFIPGAIDTASGGCAVHIAGKRLDLSTVISTPGIAQGHKVEVGIRPEDIQLGDPGEGLSWDAEIELREPLGGEVLLWSRQGGARIAIRTPARQVIRDGQTIPVGFHVQDVSIFDAMTGERL